MCTVKQNRKERTKINSACSSREEILFGVPKGSILGPLLFNIFLCDVFYMMTDTDFASYADDITQPAITCSKLTIETLEQGVKYIQI